MRVQTILSTTTMMLWKLMTVLLLMKKAVIMGGHAVREPEEIKCPVLPEAKSMVAIVRLVSTLALLMKTVMTQTMTKMIANLQANAMFFVCNVFIDNVNENVLLTCF